MIKIVTEVYNQGFVFKTNNIKMMVFQPEYDYKIIQTKEPCYIEKFTLVNFLKYMFNKFKYNGKLTISFILLFIYDLIFNFDKNGNILFSYNQILIGMFVVLLTLFIITVLPKVKLSLKNNIIINKILNAYDNNLDLSVDNILKQNSSYRYNSFVKTAICVVMFLIFFIMTFNYSIKYDVIIYLIIYVLAELIFVLNTDNFITRLIINFTLLLYNIFDLKIEKEEIEPFVDVFKNFLEEIE